MQRAVVPGASSTDDREAVIVAEGVSKQYPRDRVRLFPPIVSMFHRGWFRRSSASGEPAGDATEPRRERRTADARGESGERRRELELDYDDRDDDLDDDDDDDDDFDDDLGPTPVGRPTTARPGEMFWALKDVSFSLAPGAALGVLGGPGAGKTTLLNILGNRVFPTEGRVVTRGTISAMPLDLAKAISLSGKGYFQFDLVMGCRLLGIHPHLVKRHRDEIEALAEPVLGPDGEPAPGAMSRLAAATVLTLPADAILFDDGLRGLDELFMARALERLQDRLRGGAAVVFASRRPELVAAVCDEVIVLEGGSIVRRGVPSNVADGYHSTRGGNEAGERPRRGRGSAPAGASVPARSEESTPSVPAGRAPFHASGGLISVEVQRGDGAGSKRVHSSEELAVLIRIETVLPDTAVRCGVCFAPRSGDFGVRIEHPDPIRLDDPGQYAVVARVPAGTLAAGGYKVHADAVIATGDDSEANAVSRDAGRLRIAGDRSVADLPDTPPKEHWDGCVAWRADALWSME